MTTSVFMSISSTLQTSLRRFFFPHCLLVLLAFAALLQFHKPHACPNLLPSILTLATAFWVAISHNLLRKLTQQPTTQILSYVGLLLLLAGYYWSLHALPHNLLKWSRFFSVNLGLYSLFLGIYAHTHATERTAISYWKASAQVVTISMLSACFTLAVGLASVIGLFAIDQLLWKIPGDRYMDALIITGTYVGPAFFLLQLTAPKEAYANITLRFYPKFSQYVLLPVTCAYFLILYSYTIKIFFITHERLKTYLAYYILGFSLVGVPSITLLVPLISQNRFVRNFSRLLIGFLLPQLAIFFWALHMRIQQHGLTLLRYYALLMGGWLLVLSVYYLFSSKKHLLLAPLSLSLLLTASSYGPWGAFQLVTKNQLSRLKLLLQHHQLYDQDGLVQKTPPKQLPVSTKNQLSSTIRYLITHFGEESLEPILGKDLKKYEAWRRFLRL